MEPSSQTFEQIGRLCSAWSWLELVSEHTLWGVLKADDRWGEIISSKIDIEGIWKMILEHAKTTLSESDLSELRAINKDLTVTRGDRNVIVHGRILAFGPSHTKQPYEEALPGAADDFSRSPGWVIHKGPDAGAMFPISTEAVTIVLNNIQKLSRRIEAFNTRFGHFRGRLPTEKTKTDWPKPL